MIYNEWFKYWWELRLLLSETVYKKSLRRRNLHRWIHEPNEPAFSLPDAGSLTADYACDCHTQTQIDHKDSTTYRFSRALEWYWKTQKARVCTRGLPWSERLTWPHPGNHRFGTSDFLAFYRQPLACDDYRALPLPLFSAWHRHDVNQIYVTMAFRPQRHSQSFVMYHRAGARWIYKCKWQLGSWISCVFIHFLQQTGDFAQCCVFPGELKERKDMS